MGFLKNLFGGKSQSSKPYVDNQGVYFYVQCDNCHTPVRLRADKMYDLVNDGDGYTWHKTIVDNRCFRPIPTIVHLNSQFEVVSFEISGGQFITSSQYDALLAEVQAQRNQPAQDSVNQVPGPE